MTPGLGSSVEWSIRGTVVSPAAPGSIRGMVVNPAVAGLVVVSPAAAAVPGSAVTGPLVLLPLRLFAPLLPLCLGQSGRWSLW